MLFLSFLISFFLVLLTRADPAPVSKDSPDDAKFVAQFGSGTISGFVVYAGFQGYVFAFGQVKGLPNRAPPFAYAIHERAVPRTEYCNEAYGILDPYDGVSNAPTEAEYRVGDLSGKHGIFKDDYVVALFVDPYISLNPGNLAYIGNKAMVIRNSMNERVACVNLQPATGNMEMPKDFEVQAKKLIEEMEQHL